jgi:HSF-type DNA-binding
MLSGRSGQAGEKLSEEAPTNYEAAQFATYRQSSQTSDPSSNPDFYRDFSSLAPAVHESASELQSLTRFPEKLYDMLNRAESQKFAHIASWQPHGRCFIIRKPEVFRSVLVTLMPGTTRWKSFQRQLYMWGFRQLTNGRDSNGYFHECFLRHRPFLLRRMQRDGKRKRDRRQEHQEIILDFYAMPFITPFTSTSIPRSNKAESSREALETANSMQSALDSKPAARRPMDSSVSHPRSYGSDEHGHYEIYHSPRTSQTCTESSDAADRAYARGSPEAPISPRHGVGGRLESFGGASPDAEPFGSGEDNIERLHDRTIETNQMKEGMFDDADDHISEHLTLAQLLPRPLPPVILRQGDTTCQYDVPVPVAQHPNFVQVGPNEFRYNVKYDSDSDQAK